MDRQSSNDDTALHMAAGKGHLDIVRLLVEKGKANIAAVGSADATPLLEATKEGHYEVFFNLCQRFWLHVAVEGC